MLAAIHETINRSRLVVPDKSFHVCLTVFPDYRSFTTPKPLFSTVLNISASRSRFSANFCVFCKPGRLFCRQIIENH